MCLVRQTVQNCGAVFGVREDFPKRERMKRSSCGSNSRRREDRGIGGEGFALHSLLLGEVVVGWKRGREGEGMGGYRVVAVVIATPSARSSIGADVFARHAHLEKILSLVARGERPLVMEKAFHVYLRHAIATWLKSFSLSDRDNGDDFLRSSSLMASSNPGYDCCGQCFFPVAFYGFKNVPRFERKQAIFFVPIPHSRDSVLEVSTWGNVRCAAAS